MSCQCDPSRGQACRVCDGTDPRITAAEDRHGSHHEPTDSWQDSQDRYERHIHGDAA